MQSSKRKEKIDLEKEYRMNAIKLYSVIIAEPEHFLSEVLKSEERKKKKLQS